MEPSWGHEPTTPQPPLDNLEAPSIVVPRASIKIGSSGWSSPLGGGVHDEPNVGQKPNVGGFGQMSLLYLENMWVE